MRKSLSSVGPLLLVVIGTIGITFAPSEALAVPDTVSAILVDGDMREDWPDLGVVGFHRENTDLPLTVNFTIGGTALLGTDYSMVPSGTTITIPAGDREAWLEFAPTGQTFTAPIKTIIVTLQPGADYAVSAVKAEQVATIKLGRKSIHPCAKAAVRFLNQAAFGPNGNLANVREVMSRGYDNWITSQFVRPIGLQQPYIVTLNRAKRGDINANSRSIPWWNRAMNSAVTSDPLRQRVAFALSEIFVISDHVDELSNEPIAMVNYYDTLLRGAFGNYRDLLYKIATHPCMGIYLNHLGNEKGYPELGTFADENFAREIMQLFSIGIWELNLDGTRKLDVNKPIPSYDNQTIANMARVMTGFSFGGPKAKEFFYPPENYFVPMRMWDEFHDIGAKTLLNGVTLPERVASVPDKGTAGMADFNAAIDCLFNHPNTSPFICKQLIQKLVTSNPSPEYVGRVAAKFVNNGRGIRGDLKAVIRAILTDNDARNPPVAADLTSGKLKEPYLRTVNLARALNARAATGVFDLGYIGEIHFQEPLSAPSVFNFFKPGYAPAGPISEAGLVAPEFQILNDVTALSIPNYYLFALEWGFNRWNTDNPREIVRPHYTVELTLVNDVPALLRRLDLLLMGGTLPNEQHQLIREAVEKIHTSMWDWKLARIRMAIYLIVSAPEASVLK